MKEFLDFISIQPSTMIISVLNVIILFLFLKKILFKRVNDILEKREAEVSELYSKADDSLQESNKIKQSYEQKIANINTEKDKILKAAKDEADFKSRIILEESQQTAIRIKNETDKEIELKRRKMYSDMESELVDISVAIAEKIIDKEIDEGKHKQMVLSFIDDLEITNA